MELYISLFLSIPPKVFHAFQYAYKVTLYYLKNINLQNSSFSQITKLQQYFIYN